MLRTCIWIIVFYFMDGVIAKYEIQNENDLVKENGIEELSDDLKMPGKYKYSYGVEEEKTGDYHSHHEESDGDMVKGEYTVADPDGTVRTVRYTVGKHTGFQAIVITTKGDEHKQQYWGFPRTITNDLVPQSSNKKEIIKPKYYYYY